MYSARDSSDFLFQVGLSVGTVIIIGEPEARLRMRVLTEKHVELMCYLPLIEFLAPVAYNLTLVLLCAVYAFLTRRLPENFNESWYIFVSVATTSFMWMIFLPTYFTIYHARHQAALLAFCLFLNASINLSCLFLPKVYAIYFVSEESMTFTFMESTSVTNTTPSGGFDNIHVDAVQEK